MANLGTINTQTNMPVMADMPQVWINGVQKTQVKEFCGSGTVSGGAVIIYLTDNGLSSGNAVFVNIYKESAAFWIDDSASQYQFGEYVISENKKSLTLTINKLGNVLLGIIQLTSSSDGMVVYARILGD